jgi:type IV secretory pathway TraG/TraD family ATPase VirD4
LQGIKNLTADQRRIFTENISLILISDAPGDGKYFADGARDYFNGISLFLLSDNPDITFPEIVREILLGNGIDWVKKIVGSNCLEAKEFLASYWGQNEKNIAGCYGVLSQAVRPFSSDIMSDLLDGCGNCISPKSLEDGYDVYLQIEQSELAVYSPLLTIMTQQFLNSFLNRKPSTGMKLRPIIFLLDEFPQLHFNLKTLSTALSTLRSRAVTLLLCQQSLSQLDKLYGEAGRKEIMDTCAYYGILSVQDVQTREYFSKLIGTHKVLRISNNLEDSTQKTGRSVQEAREPIFQPEEFGSLGNYLVIYANGKYIKAEKTFYFR